MNKPMRTTVTVPRPAYTKIKEVARRRNRKVPAVIADLATEAADRELAGEQRRRAFLEGSEAVFGGLGSDQIDSICSAFRRTLDS